MSIDHVTSLPPALWTTFAAGKAAHDDNPHATRSHAIGPAPHREPFGTGPRLQTSRRARPHDTHAHAARPDHDAPVDTHRFDTHRIDLLSVRVSRDIARLEHAPVGFPAPMSSEADRFGVTEAGGPFGVPARCQCPQAPPIVELRQPAITYAAVRHPTGAFLDLFA